MPDSPHKSSPPISKTEFHLRLSTPPPSFSRSIENIIVIISCYPYIEGISKYIREAEGIIRGYFGEIRRKGYGRAAIDRDRLNSGTVNIFGYRDLPLFRCGFIPLAEASAPPATLARDATLTTHQFTANGHQYR